MVKIDCSMCRKSPLSGYSCLGYVVKCCPDDCKFYKTDNEAEEQNTRCRERLLSLDRSKRKYIADKYGIKGLV